MEKKNSGMLSPKRGAGGGASAKDGSGQQQVQASHHHRRTLEKGAIIHSINPFWKGMNPRERYVWGMILMVLWFQ